jgi:DNA invertase Pin-like site-specific DNA recombinase
MNEKNYSLVIEDQCSGTVTFFEREGGKKTKMLLDKGAFKELKVLEIDRLGRDLRDIINTIHHFTEHLGSESTLFLKVKNY